MSVRCLGLCGLFLFLLVVELFLLGVRPPFLVSIPLRKSAVLGVSPMSNFFKTRFASARGLTAFLCDRNPKKVLVLLY